METLQKLHSHLMEMNTAALLSAVEQKKLPISAKTFSIYFLNNFTINPIEPFLKYYFQESNLKPHITFGNFDNVKQEVLDNDSLLYSRQFDVIVCSLLYFPTDARFLGQLNNIASFIAELKSLFDLIQEKTTSLILINTLLPPFFSETGIVSRSDKENNISTILYVNHFIRDYAAKQAGRFFLMDWCRYMQILGEQSSLDYRYWYMYKAPFKKAFLSYYAKDIAIVARALQGNSKKCLILDCDNTLWGGIIGEDGLSGIKLDNYEHPGKVFYDFQKTVLELANKGIIIALCSKNNENDVWEVFEKHPHSLLRREHVATYRINWNDKANNILELAKELNIGLDSCVFVDDSQTECELIKFALPEVTVITVPNPIYEYPTLLLRECLFDTLSINREDIDRNIQYQMEAKRKEIITTSHSIPEYLASLELVATIHPAYQDEIPRVAQLTQKTNQFNLSTRRYSQLQIENFCSEEESAVLTLSVKDKFGNYGLTGVLIAKHNGAHGFIDTLLMSCRILSRNLEFVFLEHSLKQLKQQWGITEWKAEYIPSEKNAQIKDFLIKAGFVPDNNFIYRFNMNECDSYQINYINVMTEGLEHA